MLLKGFAKNTHAQGIGRHSKEEVEKLGIADLKALSDYLGQKPYVMGNNPTEIDAVAFAFLCIFYAGDPEDDNAVKKAADEDLTNLKEYFDRMKEKYWADWDDILYKVEEKKKKDEDQEEKKEKDDEKEKGEEDKEEKKTEEGEEKKE